MDIKNQPDKQGFYDTAYTLQEVADLVNLAMNDSLGDEITAVRIATRRTLLKLEEDLETAEFLKLVDQVHKGANTVANLLRAQRAISDQAANGLLKAIAQVIQELATEKAWAIL